MSKAEELASREWSDLGFYNNEQSNSFKLGYLKGYHQAEKDNELTWEDLAIIKQLSDDFVKHNQTPISDEEFYKEIVKRFKERK